MSRIVINQLTELLGQARTLLSRGDAAQAEPLLREVLAADSSNREALEQLFVICVQSGRPAAAEEFLRRLVTAYPAQPLYFDHLATLLQRLGRLAEAAACYRDLLAAHPEQTNSRYNLALLLKQIGQPREALEEYRKCLAQGIDQPEEVHSNMSVIQTELHQHGEARKSLRAALTANPDHVHSLYNLGLLQEEEGDWPAASASFRRILKLQPLHAGALSHIANGEKITTPADTVIVQMQGALEANGQPPVEQEELLYALGKAHDDCHQYDRAFQYYSAANQLSQARCPAYDRQSQERLVEQLIANCDEDWLGAVGPVSDEPLVFVCGMFRSGTTLLEQILAAHTALTSGGEISFFQRRIKPFPDALLTMGTAQLRTIGQAYVDYLAEHFPGEPGVINKHPENFLLLGPLLAMFPRARVINIQRQPLDNCLSLFFQPLESGQAYANDLLDIAHYYEQYVRLMGHWQGLAGDALLNLNYEDLLEDPRDHIGRALAFLGLDWQEDCLDFHRSRHRVRTASVHQVRQPLYQSSRDRWQNYSAHLEQLRSYLQQYQGN